MAKKEDSGYARKKLGFRIDKSDQSWGISYSIQHTGKRSRGEVAISFNKVSEIEESKIRRKALSLGLSKSDIVATIDSFYPNGKTGSHDLNPLVPYMRQGIGSRILERVIKDAKAHGAKLILVETGQASMKSFLEKKDYEKFNGEMPYLSYFCKRI
jgi:hypothetical protein